MNESQERRNILSSLLPTSPRTEVLSGLTVALALIPEAIAFAFVAGVDPMLGLFSAFIIGLVTAVVGGRPGMISGATGAMAVVVVGLVSLHGVRYLFPAVILCGLFQLLMGVLRLGKLIRMVPYPVMLGFVNGLAIVIGMAQLGSFKTVGENGLMDWLDPSRMGLMIALVILTMGIIHLLPKWTRAIPSSLAAILFVSLLGFAINQTGGDRKQVLTVKDMLVAGNQAAAVKTKAVNALTDRSLRAQELLAEAGLASVLSSAGPEINAHTIDAAIHSLDAQSIQLAAASVDPEKVSLRGEFPLPYFLDARYVGLLPPMNLQTLWIILPFALVLAGVGLIESLMTLSLIDEITETRGRGNRECIGQGTANVLCGLFGGMGGCAMIGQSLINVKSGGRGRLSAIVAASALLAFILFLSPLVELIPMAALVGVMFIVVIGTFEWTSLKTWHKIPKSDVLVMVFVAGYTVLMHDLASAVILGVMMSALVFAWKKSSHLTAQESFNEYGSKIYQIHGVLFFASAGNFKALFNAEEDPDDVVIDFYYSRVYDQSGLEAINTLTEKYIKLGKRIHLRHLSSECQKLLEKAEDLVEANISEDPNYHVATDKLG